MVNLPPAARKIQGPACRRAFSQAPTSPRAPSPSSGRCSSFAAFALSKSPSHFSRSAPPQIGSSAALAAQRARAQAAALLFKPRGATLTATWQSLGPLSIFSFTFGNLTGRITALALDPNDIAGNPTNPTYPTPTGTYSITVSVASASLTHTVGLTLIVQ